MPCVGTCSAGTGSLQPVLMSGCVTRSRAVLGLCPQAGGGSCPPRSICAWPLCCRSLADPRSSMHLGLELRAGVSAFGARLPGSVRRGRAVLQSTKLCLSAPPGLMGWEHTTVPCVHLFGVSHEGKCYFFQPALPGRAGRGAGCARAGRDGQAHSPALFPATALPRGSMRRCSPARADVSPLAPGTSQALPGPHRHWGAPGLGPRCRRGWVPRAALGCGP